MSTETFLFYSHLAYYPMHLEAFTYLCEHFDVKGVILADSPSSGELPSVHRQLGWGEITGAHSFEVRRMPQSDRAGKARWLRRQLKEVRPDAIWVQEEPTDYFLLQILSTYLFDRRPRIAAAVCENIFQPVPWPKRLVRRILWARLDALLATARASVDGIRAAGMPASVPAATLVAGAMPPPERVTPLPLPFTRSADDFIVAFAGRITELKGWKVLLAAVESLPARFKCILAGDGDQVSELEQRLKLPGLLGRAYYLGLIPKDCLWSFYGAADCLVLPSLTGPRWKEQFGGVLADGMAMGLPLVGSDSGSIPEVVGPAGLIAREGDSSDLAKALRRVCEDPCLRKSLGEAGRARFQAEFHIPAYARKIAHAVLLREKATPA